jgi:bifunctional enzyme Fae/Hps
LVGEIKRAFKERKILVAVAGGIDPSNLKSALEAQADIIVVGRYITQSRDANRAARDFLDQLGPDIDLFRVHVE